MSNEIRDPRAARGRAVGTALAVLVYIFLLAPVAVAIPMAFGPKGALTFPPPEYSLDLFRIFFSSPDWLRPLSQSFKVAVLASTLAMLVGVPAGYWLARHAFRGKSLFTGLVMSPMVIPHVVVALGLFLYFSYMRFNGTTLSIVLGHVIFSTPYVIILIIAGVQKLDPNLEFGAELMGASTLRMFFTVVVPQLVPSLVSAAFLAFLGSFDEVIVSWFLAGPQTVTLPVKIYSALQWELSPVLAAASTFLTAVSFVVCLIIIALRKAEPAQA